MALGWSAERRAQQFSPQRINRSRKTGVLVPFEWVTAAVELQRSHLTRANASRAGLGLPRGAVERSRDAPWQVDRTCSRYGALVFHSTVNVDHRVRIVVENRLMFLNKQKRTRMTHAWMHFFGDSRGGGWGGFGLSKVGGRRGHPEDCRGLNAGGPPPFFCGAWYGIRNLSLFWSGSFHRCPLFGCFGRK